MNKKRYFLEPPEVKEYLVKGERLTKWSEVSVLLHEYYPANEWFHCVSRSILMLEMCVHSKSMANSIHLHQGLE